MPPRRNPKSKKPVKKAIAVKPIKNQHKRIVSRLLQISLRVDDYAYNGVPICPASAARFIQEVNSYKELCVGDRRSLQVLEKIERCMKRIIVEQEEPQRSSDVPDDKHNAENPDTQENTIMDIPSNNIAQNQSFENDLSWIENLRYVREIGAEERIPACFEDSFWEGFNMPGEFNEELFQ